MKSHPLRPLQPRRHSVAQPQVDEHRLVSHNLHGLPCRLSPCVTGRNPTPSRYSSQRQSPPRRRPQPARQLLRDLHPLRQRQPPPVQPSLLHQDLHRRRRPIPRREQPPLRNAPRPPDQRQRPHLDPRQQQSPNRNHRRWQSSSLVFVVELRGFEPLTFSLRTRRATSCAIAPSTGRW